MSEIWKGVVGFEKYFEVSNTGKIRSLNYKKSGKPGELKQYQDRDGYKQLVIHKDGRHQLFKVHRKIAEAFIPNPDNLPVVMHLDDNPSNNHVSNLQWGTQAENLSALNPNKRKVRASLTEEEVQEIKSLYASGECTRVVLSERFNVRMSTITKILRIGS